MSGFWGSLNGRLALGSAVVIALATYGVWHFQGKSALSAAYETARAFETDVFVSVDYPIEPELLHEAQQMVDKWGSVDRMTQADLAVAAAELGYDLVAAVDRRGVIVASSVTGTVGYDLAKSEKLRDLLLLNGGKRYRTVEFHQPAPPMDVAGTRWVKYVGIAFPGGGFAMIGQSLSDMSKIEYLFEASMNDWHIGTSGFMLIVDPKAERIVSGFNKEDTGKSAREAGILSLKPTSTEGFLSGKVFGKASLVHPVPLDFIDYDAYVVQPLSDLMKTRNQVALIVLAVLTLVFGLGVMVLAKIVGQGRALDELRRREDERRQKDMAHAKAIQESSLVDSFPPFVHAVMRTAREVGGDFYDCFFLPSGRLMLVIADVSGKGIPAALFMMRARTEIRAVAHDGGSVSEIMAEVNARLCQHNVAEMFVTAWIGSLDVATGEVEWASAGHNPPYVVHADGRVTALVGRRSLVLAGMDGVRYATNLLKLEKGDRLFLYTDGVTEALSERGDFFGEARLEAVLNGVTGSPAEVCAKAIAAVDAFSGAAQQADDITVMTVGPREC